MAATNRDIKSIIMDADARTLTAFRDRVAGCLVRHAQSVAATSADAVELSWAASILRDRSVLFDNHSVAVDSFSEVVVCADMTANPTKTPEAIGSMSEADITTHIAAHVPFFAGN